MSLFQEFTTAESVTAVFLGLLGRPPQQAGLDHYVAAIDDPNNGYGISEMLSELVNSQPEWQEKTENLTRAQLVDYLFNNLFDRDPTYDETGSNYWVDGEGAAVPADQMVTALIEGAQAQDQVALANKVDATMDPETGFTLTNKADNLSGSDLDDEFTAALVQNDFGGVTNSLASGDRIDGGAGTDALYATLVPETTGIGAASDVIEAQTNSVENLFFTMQTGSAGLAEPNVIKDLAGDLIEVIDDITNQLGFSASEALYAAAPALAKDWSNIHIDAGDMNGIEQVWSLDSRADLTVEDVRSRPQDVTIGMSGTDPRVSYFVDFDSDVIAGDFGNSAVTYEFANLQTPANELLIGGDNEGGWVGSLEFTLNGETYIVNGDDVAAATTFAELEAAVEASLAAQGLTGLEVSLDTSFINPINSQPGATLTIFDPDGGIFSNPITNVADGATTGALYFGAEVGAPEVLDVETNILLDNVGRNDQGGILDVGGMSNQGIEIFNVKVDEKSWLASMGSTSRIVNPYTDSFRHLEVVNVEHLAGGAMGDLVIGSQVVMNTDVNPTSLPTGARVGTNGLIDVREFHAEGFEGAINLGASFTDEIYGRYLDDASEPVLFQYHGGDGGNLFTLEFQSDNVGFDPDFSLEVVGGSADDRFNILGSYSWPLISVDGGLGYDTLEVQSSIGTAGNVPAGFANIEKLVLSGTNTVNAGMAALPGVQEVWVATGSPNNSTGYDSTISDLDADTTITISGKKQTLGSANSNNSQQIGDVTLTNAQAEDQLVTLDNTGRLNSRLSVDSIVVNGAGSDVDNLEIASTGNRNTNNLVRDIQAAGASSIEFTGTQTLAAHVSALAAGPGQDLVIDGSALTAPLTLAVNGAILNGGNDDEIIGTDGADLLALYGMTGDITTDIEGFETIQFGWNTTSTLSGLFGGNVDGGVAGTDAATAPFTFNAGNVSDVETYIIALRGAGNGVTLENLQSGVTVHIGDPASTTATLMNSADNTLIGGGTLNLGLSSNIGNGAQTDVEGFSTINFNVASNGGNRTHTLNLDGDARTLVITGGSLSDPTEGLDLDITATVAGDEALPPSLQVVDFSAYSGTFNATVGDAGVDNSDTRFIFGSEDATLSLIDTDAGMADGWLYDNINDYNAIFEFTGGAAVGRATWTINNFVTEAEAPSLNSMSVLDMGGLGISNYAELAFSTGAAYTNVNGVVGQDSNGNVLAAGDLVITDGSGNSSWEVVLIGVAETELESSQNFFFA